MTFDEFANLYADKGLTFKADYFNSEIGTGIATTDNVTFHGSITLKTEDVQIFCHETGEAELGDDSICALLSTDRGDPSYMLYAGHGGYVNGEHLPFYPIILESPVGHTTVYVQLEISYDVD